MFTELTNQAKQRAIDAQKKAHQAHIEADLAFQCAGWRIFCAILAELFADVTENPEVQKAYQAAQQAHLQYICITLTPSDESVEKSGVQKALGQTAESLKTSAAKALAAHPLVRYQLLFRDVRKKQEIPLSPEDKEKRQKIPSAQERLEQHLLEQFELHCQKIGQGKTIKEELGIIGAFAASAQDSREFCDKKAQWLYKLCSLAKLSETGLNRIIAISLKMEEEAIVARERANSAIAAVEQIAKVGRIASRKYVERRWLEIHGRQLGNDKG